MINLVALPCLCVDVFDGTDELRAGGEALNFAVHASKFEEFNVSILGAVGQDSYAKFIMDSVSDKRIDVSHVRVEEDKVTAIIVHILRLTVTDITKMIHGRVILLIK